MNRHASMNRIYRLVWSDRLQTWVVVPEFVRGRGKSSGVVGAERTATGPAGGKHHPAHDPGPGSRLNWLARVVGATFLAAAGTAFAAPGASQLPTGGSVAAGQATISQNGARMDINQTSNRAVVNWDTFNVGASAHVNFNQPSASSATLNRVADTQASQILGRVTSNGQVFLVNPNGIYFGKTASVDVGGLVATTNSIGDADFMAGNTKFSRNGSTGSVVNEGQLRAALGGYIALLAPEVRNQGVIVAQLGTVAMASGEAVTLQFDSNNTLAGIVVEPSKVKALVENKGAVVAPGGVIIMSAKALDRLQGGVVRNTGTLEAQGMSMKGGKIVLEASDSIVNTGTISANAGSDGSPAGTVLLAAPHVENQGVISASAPQAAVGAAQGGGRIEIAATDVVQSANARLDVSGIASGGAVTVKAADSVALGGTVDASAAAGAGGDIEVTAGNGVTIDSGVLDTSGDSGGKLVVAAGKQEDPAPAPGVPRDPPAVAILGESSLRSRGRRGKGGGVTLTGGNVGLFGDTSIDASGATGGGTVLVGGDYQGKNPDIANAAATYVGADVTIDAGATGNGDGGKVVVWADDSTRFLGAISATGGSEGGDGGFVEVSGKGRLDFQGSVDTRAAAGQAGTLLLDPYNLTISAGTDAGTSAGSGAFDASGSGSILNVNTLQNALQSSNVVVTTGSSGAEAGNITVASTVGWFSDYSLTLSAANNIAINSGANLYAAGDGNIILNAGGSLANNGTIRTSSGNLDATVGAAIGGTGVYMVAGAASLTAPGGITLSNTANTFNGALSLSATGGAVQLVNKAATSMKGATAGAGGISIVSNGAISSAASATGISSGGALSLTTAAGTNGSINYTGPVAAGGAITLSTDGTGAISMADINGNATFSLVKAGGAVTLGDGATGALTFDSASGDVIAGTAGAGGQASGLVTITGTSITINDTIRTKGGNVNLTSTSGAVTANAGATITTSADADTGTASGAITVTAANGITLQNLVTTGASNAIGVGSNAAAVTLKADAGDINLGAVDTSGGNATTGTTTNRNGGNAGNIIIGAPAGTMYLNGNLTAVGGIPVGSATQGLGGYIELQTRAVLKGDRLVSSGGTSGDIVFKSTVDSDATARRLEVTAGTGSVTFTRALGATAALSSLNVTSSNVTRVQDNVTTNAAAGVAVNAITTRLGDDTVANGSGAITIDTSAGNGTVSFAPVSGYLNTVNLDDAVTFKRGAGQISFSGDVYSKASERNDLTFTGAGGGAVSVGRYLGGSGINGNSLGNILFDSGTDFSVGVDTSAKSLVALNNTGQFRIGSQSYTQTYDGALGLQLRTTGTANNASGGENITVYTNVNVTNAAAPISIAAPNGSITLNTYASLTSAGGDISLNAGKGALTLGLYTNISSNGGTIALNGIGVSQALTDSTLDAGSGKIRVDGGGAAVSLYGRLATTNADSGGTSAILITNAGGGGNAASLRSVTATSGTLQVGVVDGTAVAGSLYQYLPNWGTDSINIKTLSAATTGAITITSNSNIIDQLGNFSVGSSLDVRARGRSAGMALTGDVTATAVTIMTGNGALALGERSITSTSGDVLLQGAGLTQGAGSTIRSAGATQIYGNDYQNGTRGNVTMAGSIVSAGNVSILSTNSLQLPNITIGNAGARGTLTLGADSNNNQPLDTYNGIYGAITQAADTALKIGTLAVWQQSAGDLTLANAGNEIASLGRIRRQGAVSIYDKDTEGNGLSVTGRIADGYDTATTIATEGTLKFSMGGDNWLSTSNAILSGNSISGTLQVDARANSGNVVLRANGGDVSLTGGQILTSGTGNIIFQSANNVALGAYMYGPNVLQLGIAGTGSALAASQTAAAGSLALNGGAISGGKASFGSGQRIAVSSSDAATVYTITGTDAFGRAQTETVTGSGTGTKYFSTVTQVAADRAGAIVTVGTATETIAGNVTQSSYLDGFAKVQGAVGGNITLTSASNNFVAVGDLAAGGNISLYSTASGNPLTVSGALASSAGNIDIRSAYNLKVAGTGSVSANGAAKGVTLTAATSSGEWGYGLDVQGAISAGSGGINIGASYGAVSTSGAGTLATSGTATIRSATAYSFIQGTDYSTTIGAAVSGGTGIVIASAGSFSNSVAGTLTSSAGSVAIKTYWDGANARNLTLGGNVTAGESGIQLTSAGTINQTGGVLTTSGTLSGLNQTGGVNLGDSTPSARGAVTLTGANHLGGLGPIYVYSTEAANINVRDVDGGLTLAGSIESSHGGVTLSTAGGALNLATYNVYAGGQATGGANISLTGQGILQAQGKISATGGTNGNARTGANGGGTITLTGHDGSAYGAIALSGTLETASADSVAAIKIRGTDNLTLPNVNAPNGTLALGDDTGPAGLITGNITQAVNTSLNIKTLALGTANNPIGGSAVLANSGNKIAQLGLLTVGDVGATQYDLDIYDAEGGLILTGDVTSAGGLRIRTAKDTGATGALVLGSRNLTASGDIFLGGQSVSQAIGSTINADGSGSKAVGGSIRVDGGGGTNSIDLSGTVSTDNAGATAIQIVNAKDVTLNMISAVNGTVALGIPANTDGAGTQALALTGTVSQTTPGTSLLSAQTLAVNAGVVTLSRTTLDNLGAVATSGALTLTDTGGAGSAGLKLTGNARLGAASAITTTDGVLDLGGYSIDATGADLKLTGAGVRQSDGSSIKSTTAEIAGNSGNIDLFSNLNDFTGQVTVTGSGASVRLQDANQLSMNALTDKLAKTTSFTAWAGTQVMMTTEDITTSSGSIELRSLGGNLLTPGKLTTGSGNVTLVASGVLTLASSLQSDSGDITLSGAAIASRSGAGDSIRTGAGGDISVTATAGNFTQGLDVLYQTASGDITVNAQAGNANLANLKSSGGTVRVNAGGDIQQQGGTTITAAGIEAVTKKDAGGAINLTAAGNHANYVTLRSLSADGSATAAGAIQYLDNSGAGFAVRQIDTTGTSTLTASGAITTDSATGPGTVKAGTLNVKTLNDNGASVSLTAAGNDVGTLNVKVRKADDSAIASSTANDATTGAAGTIRFTDANGFIVGGIETGASTILSAGGAVTQTGAIDSAKLGLSGSGSFTLNAAANGAPLNRFGTIASNTTGAVSATSQLATDIGTVANLPAGVASQGAAFTLSAASISASAGIDTRSGAAGTSGGAVNLTTTGSGAAGNLAAGSINTSGKAAASGSGLAGGAAGNVTLTASGDSLSVGGAIVARGGAGDGAGAAGADGTAKLLAAAGAVNQAAGSGGIDAGKLDVSAQNTSALLATGNKSSLLAARITGADQDFSYRSAANFTVGGGDVAIPGITTQGGDIILDNNAVMITVNEPVSTRGGAFSALNVGGFNAAGVTISTGGDVTYAGGAYKNGGAIRISSAAGNIVTGTLSADGDSNAAAAGAGAITVSTGGAATVGNISARGVGSSAGGAVALTGAVVNLAGNIDTSGGGVDAGAAAGGAITVTGAAIVQGGAHSLSTGAGAGDIKFTGTVNSDSSARDLSLTAGTGNISFGATLGGVSALNNVLLVSANDITLAGVNAAGLTQVAGTGTTTLGGAVNLGGNLAFTGKALAVNAAVTTAGKATISNTGLFSTSAAGDIAAAGGFTQNGAGASLLAGDISTTGTGIGFAGAVALGGNVVLDSNGGNIAFAGTLDSDAGTRRNITLDAGAGNVTLTGKVGATAALGALTVAAARDVTVSNTADAASFTQQAGSGVTTFAKAVTLSGDLDFTGTALNVNDAVTAGGAVDVSNSGLFTVASGAAIAATGGFVQDGMGASALAGSISTTGTDIEFGSAIVLTGDATLSTGNATGAITLAVVDADGVQARKLALTTGTGGIELGGNIGAVHAVDTLALKSAGAITQGAGSAVKASKLGIEASGNVTLTNAGNDVGTLAASLNGNAGLQYRDANGFVLGSVGGLAGLTDNAGASNVGLIAGGLVAQVQGAAILLNGNLSIDTSAYNAGNVSVTNTNAAGTVLDNTLIGNDFTLDSTGPVTQIDGAYLRVGGNFNTPHGALLEGATSDNFFQGGAASVSDPNQIRLNGVITLSQSGNLLSASYVDASGTTHANAVSVDLSQVTSPLSIVSDAGGKTIVAVNNTDAISLTGANRIGGALKITTYGGYQDTGVANATGIVASGALNIGNDVTFTAQQSSANSASSVAGAGQVRVTDSANVFGGTVSATARGMGIQIADSTDLSLGNMLGSQLLLDLGQGASQAAGSQINVASLVIRTTPGGSGGTITFDQANLVDQVAASVNGALTLNIAGTFTPGYASAQVASVTPFDGGAAVDGIRTNNHAVTLSSAVDLDIAAAIDSGSAATTISASAKGQNMVLGGAGNTGDLVLGKADLANISAASTRFAVTGGGSLAAGNVNFNAGDVTLQAGDVVLSGSIGTGAGDTLTVDGATRLASATTVDGNAHFTGTVDSENDAANSLSVSGDAVFGATVGQQAQGILGSVQVDGKAMLGGAIATAGTQTYGGDVKLGADSVLSASSVTLDGDVDGQSHDLTVDGDAVTHGSIANVADLAVTGTAAIGGNVATSGKQVYTGAATLAADVTLSSTNGGAIGFAGTLDGAHALTVNTSGATTFGGAMGGTVALASVGTDAGGSTHVDGGLVATTGAQTYGDKIVLGADTVLDGSTVSLNGGADGQSHDLTVDGNAVTGAAVTNVADLAVSGTVAFGGDVTTSGKQAYTGAATLAFDAVLSSTNGGDIGFAATLDGAHALTVNTAGVTTFGGAVGGTVALASVSTDAGGSTRVDGGLVATTGTQTYGDDVLLGADTTLSGGAVNLDGGVDGQSHDLTVDSDFVTDGVIGNVVDLAVTGSAGINGNVATLGTQTYTGAVTLGADATFTATAFTTGSTIDAGSHDLAIRTDGVNLGGAVSGSGELLVTTLTAGRAIDIADGATGNASLVIGAADLERIGGGFAGVTFGDASTGTITVGTEGAQVAMLNDTTLRSGADVEIAGDVTIAGGKTVTVDAAAASAVDGSLAGNGGLATTGAGTLSLNTANTYTGTTTIGAGATLAVVDQAALGTTAAVRNSGLLDLAGTHGATTATVNGSGDVNLHGQTLTLSDAQGTIGGTISGDGGHLVIGGGALTLSHANTYTGGTRVNAGATLTVAHSQALGTSGAGVTVAAGGALALDGGNGGLDIANALALQGTGVNGGGVLVNQAGDNTISGAVSLGAGDVSVTGLSGNLNFDAAVDGAADLAIDSQGTVRFGAAVGAQIALASLSTDGGGATVIDGGLVATSGAQTYGDGVTLGADTTLKGTSVTLNGAVGGQAHDLVVYGDLVTGAAITGVAELAVSGTVAFGGDVTTSGKQAYTGAATLAADAVLSSTNGGDIGFASTLDGAHALTVNTSGVTVFGGAVGGNTALIGVTTGGATHVDGGAVNTSGAQSYGDVTLGADTTFKGASVTLNGGVDGQSHDLTVDGNAVTGAAIANVADLAVTGTAAIGGDVATSGAQGYTGAATLAADVTLSSSGGGDIGFAGTLDGAHALTVNTSGTTRFGGAVGGGTALSSVAISGATDIDGGVVATTGTQTYGDVTLGAGTTLAGSTVTLNGDVDGNGHDLAIDGNAVTGAIAGVDDLSITGTSSVNGDVTTSGSQTYTGAATLAADALLSSTGGGDIGFGDTLDGAHALTVATTGTTTFGGAVAVDSLSTGAGATEIDGGSITTSGTQTYGGNVVLGADTTLATGGGAVTFGGTVDAAGAGKDLTVNAGSGAVAFNGAVGAAANGALGDLVVNGGTISLNGDVSTTGDQAYGAAVQVQSDLTIKTGGGDLEFAGALGQAAGEKRNLTVDAGKGSADFTGPVTLASLDIAAASGATLDNRGNAIGAIAAKLGNGGLSLDNTTGITVGIGTNGITSGGAVAIHAQRGDVVLERGVSVSGISNIVLDAADGNFVNHAGASALSTASGRWQVYSTDPSADNRGGLSPDFKQYNARFGDTLASGGNGFVYSIAPVITGQLVGQVQKVYDGGTNAVLAAGNYDATLGAIDGDVVTLNTPVFGSYDSKTAGAGKLVTVNGVQVLNAMDGNVAVYGYQLASNTLSGAVGVVDKAMIQIAGLVALNKVYDGTDTAYLNTQAAKATGVMAGDQISLVSATGYYVDGKNVGAGKAIVADDIRLAGADKDNYQMVPTTGLASDVTARALVVSASGGSKTYDVTTGTTVTLADNRVEGDVLDIGYQANYLDKNAGTSKYIKVSDIAISGQDAQNYTVNTSTASFGDIAKADLTVHATGVSRSYDGTTNATVILSDDRATAAMQGDQLTLSYEAAAFTSKGAGLGKTINVLGVSVGGIDAGNYNVNLAPARTASADINGIHLTLSGVQALDKVYDGTTNAVLDLARASLTGVVAGDSVSLLGTLGSGVFASKDAGASPIAVSVTGNGIQLTGNDADGYLLDLPASLTASITPKALTAVITAPGKVYDGNATAAPTVTITGGLVGNELLTATGTASFDSKNVGTRVVTLDTVALHADAASGALASNYVLVAGQTTAADITRLESVVWTGGPHGDWFDPNNWEGGAVPDFANVKDVLIPGDVTIDFDPAPNGAPVYVDSIVGTGGTGSGGNGGNGGTLNIGGGTLNTGSGGVKLGGFNQSGGTLTSGGDVSVDTFVQTGGTTVVEGDFSAHGGFDQGGNGTLTVGGTTTIVSDGGVVIGNLTSKGELDVTSKGGPITQSEGTTIVTEGDTTLTADDEDGNPADITLANEGNDFGGPVTVNGKDVRLSDKNDLTVDGKTSGGLTTQSGGTTTLGDTTVGGDLDVTAKGPVKQTDGGTLTVGGKTTLESEGDITLGNGGNDFGGPVTVSGKDVLLSDKDDLTVDSKTSGGLTTQSGGTTTLGTTTVGGNLDVTAKGPVIQGSGGTLTVGGGTTLGSEGDITLGNVGNDFDGPVTVSGKDVRLSDKNDLTVGGKTSGGLTTQSGGATTLGTTTVGGKLDVTSGGSIGQSGGSTLGVTGSGTLNSGGNVVLDNTGNDFAGPVAASGKDVRLSDSAGGLVLGKVDSTGGLVVTSTGGAIQQGNGGTIHAAGTSSFTASDKGNPADVLLNQAGNDLVGAVSVNGRNVNLVDGSGGITLGTVKTGGALLVAATGAITQAPGQYLDVAGYSTFSSGINKVELTTTGNNLRGGSNLNSVTVLTPVAPVAAMPVLGAGPQVQAVGNVASAATVSTVAAAAPASAGAIAPVSVAIASGIVVRTVQTANAAQNGLISVGVPKAVGTFAFNVPAEAFANQAQGGIVVSSVSLENGAALPSWLQFNVNDLSFTASSIPANGLPLRVVVSTAGKRVVVVISELEANSK